MWMRRTQRIKFAFKTSCRASLSSMRKSLPKYSPFTKSSRSSQPYCWSFLGEMFSSGVTSVQRTSLRYRGVKKVRVVEELIRGEEEKKVEGRRATQTGTPGGCESGRQTDLYLGFSPNPLPLSLPLSLSWCHQKASARAQQTFTRPLSSPQKHGACLNSDTFPHRGIKQQTLPLAAVTYHTLYFSQFPSKSLFNGLCIILTTCCVIRFWVFYERSLRCIIVRELCVILIN